MRPCGNGTGRDAVRLSGILPKNTIMDILYIGDDQREIALVYDAVNQMKPRLIFDSVIGLDAAFQKIYHRCPRIVLMQPQRDTFCHQLLSTLKNLQLNKPSYLLLINSALTSEEVDEFHALGVHYFIDKKVFFKETHSMIEIIVRSICIS
jgi:hypothetical protein